MVARMGTEYPNIPSRAASANQDASWDHLMRKMSAHFLLLLPTPCHRIVDKLSQFFFFFSSVIILFGYSYNPMCIAQLDLIFLWIVCLLADFCGSAHHFNSHSAICLVQNVLVASRHCGYIHYYNFVDTTQKFSVLPAWYTGISYFNCLNMSSVKNITSSSRRHADKSKARRCGHWINAFDVHNYCPSCRENNTAKGKLPSDPCMKGEPCQIVKHSRPIS